MTRPLGRAVAGRDQLIDLPDELVAEPLVDVATVEHQHNMSCRQRRPTKRCPIPAGVLAATLLILQPRTRWRKPPEFSGPRRVPGTMRHRMQASWH